MKKSTTTRRTGVIARDGAGRIAPFEPTVEQRKLVEKLSGIGVPHDEICLVVDWGRPDGLPINAITLRRRFRHELDRGKAVANTRIKQSLFEAATGGHFGSQVFWLKTQCGWKETQVVEAVGRDGAPLSALTLGPVLYLPEKAAHQLPARPPPGQPADKLAGSAEGPPGRREVAHQALDRAQLPDGAPGVALGRIEPLEEHISKRFRI